MMENRYSEPIYLLPTYQYQRHGEKVPPMPSPVTTEIKVPPGSEPWDVEMRAWRRSGEPMDEPPPMMPHMPHMPPMSMPPMARQTHTMRPKSDQWSTTRNSSSPPESVKALIDPDIVDWDGPNDPTNPQNWPMWRKYMTSLILSLFLFVGNFSGTMVAPALDIMGEELGMPPGVERTLILSLSLFAGSVSPMFFAPLIEIYGRAPLMIYPQMVHLIFITACGFAANGPQLLAFRFFAAIGAAPPGIIAPGLTADTYPADMGGLGDTMHSMLPFVGTALGPIVGAQIAATGQWRWIFWSTSFISFATVALAHLFLKETLHGKILGRKAARLREETGNPRLRTQWDHPDMAFNALFQKRVLLPFIMLVSHPIVQLPFLYRAYLFGILALVIGTFEQVWETQYGMDKSTASFNYFALMAGFIIGLQLSHHLIDGFSAYFRKRTGLQHKAEWRIPPSIFTAMLVPTGLVIYGWSAENRLHWSLPNLGIILLCIGLILGWFSMQPYVTDNCGPEYASSAHSVGSLLKGLMEFSFPLFAPALYQGLGLGVGNTLLALLTLSIGIPVPMIFWFFGPKIQGRSKNGFPVWPSVR